MPKTTRNQSSLDPQHLGFSRAIAGGGNSHIKPLEKSVERSPVESKRKFPAKTEHVLYNMKGVMMLPNKGLNYYHLLINFRYIYI